MLHLRVPLFTFATAVPHAGKLAIHRKARAAGNFIRRASPTGAPEDYSRIRRMYPKGTVLAPLVTTMRTAHFAVLVCEPGSSGIAPRKLRFEGELTGEFFWKEIGHFIRQGRLLPSLAYFCWRLRYSLS